MNPTKQFWTLVKFQYVLNPMMWFLPMLIGVISFIPFLIGRHSTYHSSLSLYFTTHQTFFFVGIFGSMLLAPEKFQFNRMKTANAFLGTEFLLTRAVDRPIIYRAKAFLVYALVLLLPIGALIYFTSTPELIVNESSKADTQQVIDHIPSGILVPQSNQYMQPNIILPYGKVLIAEWQLWVFLLAVIVLQIAISILSPYKFGSRIFWLLCYLGLLGPAFLPLFWIEIHARDTPSFMEKLFFFFVEHQPIVWIATLLAAMLCQLFCERNFSRQEQ